MENEQKPETKKIRISKAKIGLFIGGIIIGLVVGLFASGFVGVTGFATGDANSVGRDTVNYINANLMSGGERAVLQEATFDDGMYQLELLIAGQPYTSYVSSNGELLFTQAIEMVATGAPQPQQPEQQQQQPTPTVTKADKPKVELFVMSHCPFGTQAEKGIIPVVELLGDQIDFDLMFVNYAMHPTQGEVEAQLTQHCIQEEQNEKFLPFLKCFLEDGNSERCINEIGIDQAKLTACEARVDAEFSIMDNLNDQSGWLSGRFPVFAIHDEENKAYGVQGSPTLVINGEKVSSSRSPSAYLAVVCAAFNNAPEECNQQLSTATPSSGFGWDGAAASGGSATCG